MAYRLSTFLYPNFDMRNQLKERWHILGRQCTDQHELLDQLWMEISDHYQESHRHYHNFTHLQHLFQEYDEYETSLVDAQAVAFAIWYHDIIYKTTSKRNEEKSAELAVRRLRQLALSEDRLQRIFDLIMATKGHQLPVGNDSRDMAYFLDFDLCILGSSPEKYQQYSQQIRQEYHLIPGMLYRPGRIKVLRHLLEQDFLYKTVAYQEAFEQQARENLKWEIAQLAR